MVARLFNQKSRLGTYLDPIADKTLLVGAFVVLSVMGFLPPWLTVTVISRDILILLGVSVLVLNRVDLHIRPSLLSKFATCFQFFTVLAALSRDFFEVSPRHSAFFFYGTAFFTISSGLHYMHSWFKMMSEGIGER
jgi:cardiolipin synthase